MNNKENGSLKINVEEAVKKFKEKLFGEELIDLNSQTLMEQQEHIDELDDLNGPDLIKKFKEELPDVYEHNLTKCRGGIIDNNFPSDSDIRFTLRINRVETKDIEDFNNGGRERLRDFIESPLGQRFLNGPDKPYRGDNQNQQPQEIITIALDKKVTPIGIEDYSEERERRGTEAVKAFVNSPIGQELLNGLDKPYRGNNQ